MKDFFIVFLDLISPFLLFFMQEIRTHSARLEGCSGK